MVEKNLIKDNQFILLEELGKQENVYGVFDSNKLLKPEFYVAKEFREASGGVNYHSLTGYKRITSIIAENSTFVNSVNGLEIILNRIDSIDPVMGERKYSKDFYWIKF
jgi:hypothetical protein